MCKDEILGEIQLAPLENHFIHFKFTLSHIMYFLLRYIN